MPRTIPNCKENNWGGIRAQIKCVETQITYRSIQDAVDALGISRHAISRCLRGIQKTAGGFSWEYVTRIPESTLCWSCSHACGDGVCSWTSRNWITGKVRFQPVTGWDAKRERLNFGKRYVYSYRVSSCPLYDPEPERDLSRYLEIDSQIEKEYEREEESKERETR